MSKSRKHTPKRAKRNPQTPTYRRSDIVRFGVENHVILNLVKPKIIGVEGGVINPIIRNSEFIVKVQNLPAYKSVASEISSKENLPKIHFSRETYRKVWTSVIQDYNNQENQTK